MYVYYNICIIPYVKRSRHQTPAQNLESFTSTKHKHRIKHLTSITNKPFTSTHLPKHKHLSKINSKAKPILITSTHLNHPLR